MLDKWNSKKETIPQIDIITKWDKGTDEFYAPGALIRVQNGKKLLAAKFSEEPGDATYYTLMFQGKPLFQFQGDEYYCPTCEKIVRSGYQLEQTEEFHIEKVNQENTPFADALEEIMPLLGLLSDNYYVILDIELYPTDGTGHLFWNVPNSEERLPGSCLFYRGDGEWGLSRPHFTIATQSIKKMCKDRVDYYRNHPNCRAIAYYMDGYMTALIDGHHKAMAAAIEHKKVKALVIMPCFTIRRGQRDGKLRAAYIQAGDIRFACDEYALKEIPNYMGEKISSEEMKQIQNLIPEPEYEFPYENDELVSYYPDVDEIANMDEVGEISNEWLDQIISESHICNIDEIGPLIKALGGLRHARLWEIADYFLWKCSYLSFLRLHDTETVTTIIKGLMKVPRSDELEQYLIDVMVEYEEEYPSVGRLIMDYF